MGSRPAQVLCIVLAAVLAAACGGAADTSEGSDAPATSPGEIRLVTFNAGLAGGFVPLAEERVSPVVEAVAGLDADVVAVQEVWEAEDVDRLSAAATSAGFDDITFLPPAPEESNEPACPEGELDSIEACVEANCADVPDDQLAECVLASCGVELGELCDTCQTCLSANIGGSLESIVGTCSEGASAYAYGGSFGVGVLSQLPVGDRGEVVFDSSLNRRAVLYTRVDTEDIGDLHVFSTHLSAVFSDVPYPGDGTWEEEQAEQIRRLLAFIDETVPAGEPVVVMGDLNTGPPVGSLPGEVPDNFALFTEAGFESPYVAGDDAECTFCADNPLVGGADDASVVLDHVLVRDLDATVVAERILDEEILVDGSPTRLSDHYGVAVTITASGVES